MNEPPLSDQEWQEGYSRVCEERDAALERVRELEAALLLVYQSASNAGERHTYYGPSKAVYFGTDEIERMRVLLAPPTEGDKT